MALTDYLTNIANAIRIKEESTDLIPASSFADRIINLPVNKVSQSGLAFTACKKINDGWKFNKVTDAVTGNEYDSTAAQGALSKEFSDVDIPHDWSIYNNFNSASRATYEGGYLDGGDAWYKSELLIEDETTDNRYFLYFEGIYMESDILLNGTHINTHKNGYTNFIVEITDTVVLNQPNEILIYVKNRQPSSRWYSGSGIYRDVYLLKSGKVGIEQQSIKITTPDLETEYPKGYATTKIETSIENTTGESAVVTVENTVKYFGQEVCSTKNVETIDAETSKILSVDIIISEPKLWGEYDGQYYTLETRVLNSSGETVSSVETYYGYRWFKFDPNTGFYLNGKALKMLGACMHHDLGVLGAEANQSAVDRQIRILKEAGFNAIRFTHNPSCAEYTNACMRYGIMCIEEAFDCWTISKKLYDYGRFFLEYAESDIKSMVKRSRNNPAVIMWSLGNEIYDTRSSEADSVLQDPVVTATNLRNWVRELDVTRPCTMGENSPYDATAKSVMNVMDVQGVNYSYSHYRTLHNGYPTWCVYGSETASSISSRGIYSEDPDTVVTGYDQVNHQCSSYDNDKVGWGSLAYNTIDAINVDYVFGTFIWTGFDYIGEPTPFNKHPCRSSYFGIVDIAGIPKDAYYLYQSMWTDKPMCHIVPMDWTKWTVESNVKVMVYSNADSVELFLNGTSLGTMTNKSISDATSRGSFYMTVPFAKGRLVANAKDTSGNLIAQDVVYTSKAPAKVVLKSDKIYLAKDSDELVFITAEIVDADGHLCIQAANAIAADVTNGEIIGIDNGNATSVEKYRSASKSVFSGKAVCVVRPYKNGINVTVRVSSDGLTVGNITVSRSTTTVYTHEQTEMIDATEPYAFVEDGVACTGIDITSEETSLSSIGDTLALDYTVTPVNCTDIVLWESDNIGVAIVNNGTITAVNSGTAIITLTCGKYSDTYTITVDAASVDCETLVLSDTSITLTDTSQHDIAATVTPENCTYDVGYTSSDTNVLTVDNGGHMTAVANGECQIIATCGTKTATCEVVVNLETVEPEITLSSISAEKTQTVYNVGDELNTDDIIVTATYSDGSSHTVSGYIVNYENVDMDTNGKYTISISYTEGEMTKLATISITVGEVPESEWDYIWDGTTNTLPTGMEANGSAQFTLNEATGKYEFTTSTNGTEASVNFDYVGRGILEIEIESTNWTDGLKGWTNGMEIVPISGKRQALFTTSYSESLKFNTDSNVVIDTLEVDTLYKMRLDSIVKSNTNVYINDATEAIAHSTLDNTAANATNTKVYTGSISTKIKSIKLKKAVVE